MRRVLVNIDFGTKVLFTNIESDETFARIVVGFDGKSFTVPEAQSTNGLAIAVKHAERPGMYTYEYTYEYERLKGSSRSIVTIEPYTHF